MALLAVALLLGREGHPARRAFSFLLFARGASLVALATTAVASTVETTRLAATLYPLFCLATVASIVFFLGLYPRRRAWLPTGPWAPALLALVLLVLGATALLAPDLARPSGTPRSAALTDVIAWLRGSPLPAFGAAPTLLDLSFALPALLLVREHFDLPPGRRKGTLLIVSLGFFAPAACSCLIAGAFLQTRPTWPQPETPNVFNYIELGLFGIWFVTLAGLLAYLAVRAIRSRQEGARRTALLFVSVILGSTALGASTAAIDDMMRAVQAIYGMVSFWSVLGAATVCYGVLRYSLFDIDLKLKASVWRSIVAASFVAVYFLVTEIATVWFSDVSGSDYWGVFAAGALLLLLQPLQKIAEQLADRLMPGTRPLGALGDPEQLAFYREQVDLMWMDGHLSARDRKALANLREHLKLDPGDAERVELEVLAAQGG